MERNVTTTGVRGRRLQLAAAVLGMGAIAPLQYSWTLFAEPLSEERAWSLAAVQVGFTVFVVFQTFTQPVTGPFIDRFGPGPLFVAGALLVGLGWGAMGRVGSLPLLYAAYAAAGLGAGVVYGGSIGTALRWFPDRRGLAVGLVTAGFGAGALPFLPILDAAITARGTPATFVVSAVVLGIVLLACAAVLRHPPAAAAEGTEVAAGGSAASPSAPGAASPRGLAGPNGVLLVAQDAPPPPARQYTSTEMVRTARFWLIFAMYWCMATGGLLVTANLRPFATSLGVASGVVVTALVVAQVPNGLSRIVWGWVSDRIGRLLTMVVAFALNGVLLALLPFVGDAPAGLIVLTPLVMFTWGEAFALIPAVTADSFGTEHAAANQGVMYTAKGIGGLLGGALAAWLAAAFGWTAVFLAAAGMALTAAGGAVVLMLHDAARRRG